MKRIIYPNGIFFDVLFIFTILTIGIAISTIGVIFCSNAIKNISKKPEFNESFFGGKTIECDGHIFYIINYNNDEKFIHCPSCPCKEVK